MIMVMIGDHMMSVLLSQDLERTSGSGNLRERHSHSRLVLIMAAIRHICLIYDVNGDL